MPAERVRKAVAPVLVIGLLLSGAVGLRSFLAARSSQVIGGPYALMDTQGRDVTQSAFHGRYTLIYFGYTHCIDVCPLTLATVSQALDMLGPKAHRVVPIFISVDPSRDTPDVVGDYVRHFSPDIVGLTGSVTQIHTVIEEFHVMARRRATIADHMSDDYLMDHSSVLYLMDGENRLVSVLPVDSSPQEIAGRLRRLLPAS
ncbi:electron transporter SenC [Gluconobacter potus]|uniref:Electron transporter SenC n=1 Tax=Gluconobacter potus TaxID=2724927 RepID=A0A149QV38_9PROT|nr:SCO family protein [Gluconobacter potus]KXV01131.1 electron transporter SenC [Gluconobacter potus]